MTDEIKIRKSTICLVIGILIILFWVFLSPITFEMDFMIEETEENIDGDIYVEGKFYGTTTKGKLIIYEEEFDYLDGKEFSFEVEYNNSIQTYLFDFENDLYEEIGVEYVISLKDLESYVEDQFPNTYDFHWDHMPITYNADSCSKTFEGKMMKDIQNSFIFISNRTDNLITFQEYSMETEADITFICDIGGIETKRNRIDLGWITEAEAIPYEYPGTNIFAPSEIYIYATHECLGERPILIIHEILHLFNLEHNINPSHTGDIMHPYLSDNCDADILEKDIDYLKSIYS